MSDKTIKKLSEFGEGFRHHHENYAVSDITRLRETGGTWTVGALTFYFPEHFGFCYGVDKAIDMVFETCERFKGRRIFLTDQLIHNPYINGKLREKGVQYLKRDEHHLLRTEGLGAEDIVVVSAFGTDFRDILRLREKKATIVDSTCGAIINVWKRVEGYAKNGFITVVHGKRQHEETRATVSQAVKEGGDYITIENKLEAHVLASLIRGEISREQFIRQFPDAVSENLSKNWLSRNSAGIGEDFGAKIGMANQTTMLKGESLEIQEILRQAFLRRFGEAATKDRFRSFDTICGATQDRQDAMRNLLGLTDPSRQSALLDLVLIVGGFNSSNTSHLAEIADGKIPFFHIEGEADILSKDEIRCRNPRTGQIEIDEEWFPDAARRIGVTSGASTPDVTLLEIIQKISSFRAKEGL